MLVVQPFGVSLCCSPGLELLEFITIVERLVTNLLTSPDLGFLVIAAHLDQPHKVVASSVRAYALSASANDLVGWTEFEVISIYSTCVCMACD